MKATKQSRETINFFNSLGVKIDRAEKTKVHYKYYVSINNHKHLFIRSGSPSDRRGWMNFQSDVKKWMKSLTTS